MDHVDEDVDLKRKVIVVIIPDDACVPRNNVIRYLFSNPMFNIIDVKPKVGNNVDTPGLTSDQYFEICAVRDGLLAARNLDPLAACIIIKDTSTSASDPSTVANIVSKSLAVDCFDLCYLCKWLDMCQLYTDVGHDTKNDKISLMKTKSPHGIQAILFSVQGRDIVLGTRTMANGQHFIINNSLDVRLSHEIFNCNISAICTVPNVIDYDIAFNASSNSDFIKANECVPVTGPQQPIPNSEGNIVGFILIVSLILLVAWAFLRCGPRR